MSQILQTLTLAIFAWIAYSQLSRIHWLLILAVMLFATLNVLTAWSVRYRPQSVATLCRRRFVDLYVGSICSLTGQQRPIDRTASERLRQLLLHTPSDYQTAAVRAKQIVRGHDHVIDAVMARLHENNTLRRSRRSESPNGPLAAFLLVGGEGIGKRHLARVLARLLYQDGGVAVLECDQVTPNHLVSSDGELLEAVRSDPCTLVLFEQVDTASDDVSKSIVQMLTTGTLRPTDSDRDVCFQNTVVVLTTTKAVSAIGALRGRSLVEAVWHQRAVNVLGEETMIDHGILNALTDLYVLDPPSDTVKAEVAALLMKRECKAHHIELSHVDAEILATQVMRFDAAGGFGLAPQQVKKLLRKPLVASAGQDRGSLSLRVRRPSSIAPMETPSR